MALAEESHAPERPLRRATDAGRATVADRPGDHRRAAAAVARARILLEADIGPDDAAIADALDTGPSAVHRVRQAFAEDGWDDAPARKTPTGRQSRKLDGAQEARRIAAACGEAPDGRARWTLRLLAGRPVELRAVECVGPECGRATPERPTSSRGSASRG